jgi:CheY-like chemotaxis protein
LPSFLAWLIFRSLAAYGGLGDGKGRQEMRVLLIEDEPTTAKAIELMLTTEGFNVYTTDLGEEGLDLGKLYDYDIICLDLNLPTCTAMTC